MVQDLIERQALVLAEMTESLGFSTRGWVGWLVGWKNTKIYIIQKYIISMPCSIPWTNKTNVRIQIAFLGRRIQQKYKQSTIVQGFCQWK